MWVAAARDDLADVLGSAVEAVVAGDGELGRDHDVAAEVLDGSADHLFALAPTIELGRVEVGRRQSREPSRDGAPRLLRRHGPARTAAKQRRDQRIYRLRGPRLGTRFRWTILGRIRTAFSQFRAHLWQSRRFATVPHRQDHERLAMPRNAE